MALNDRKAEPYACYCCFCVEANENGPINHQRQKDGLGSVDFSDVAIVYKYAG